MVYTKAFQIFWKVYRLLQPNIWQHIHNWWSTGGAGRGRDESGRRYYLADDSRSFSSLRGYRGLLQQDYSHQFRSCEAGRAGGCNRSKHGVRLRILDPFISAPAALLLWSLSGLGTTDRIFQSPVSPVPGCRLHTAVPELSSVNSNWMAPCPPAPPPPPRNVQ